MVTSHLRMVASLRQEASRSVAVAATLDLVLNALQHLHSPAPPAALVWEGVDQPMPAPAPVPAGGCRTAVSLPDAQLFGRALPPFDSCFVGRSFHKSRLAPLAARPPEASLGQGDLLSSLKFLASVRCDDVSLFYIMLYDFILQFINSNTFFDLTINLI